MIAHCTLNKIQTPLLYFTKSYKLWPLSTSVTSWTSLTFAHYVPQWPFSFSQTYKFFLSFLPWDFCTLLMRMLFLVAFECYSVMHVSAMMVSECTFLDTKCKVSSHSLSVYWLYFNYFSRLYHYYGLLSFIDYLSIHFECNSPESRTLSTTYLYMPNT